MNLSNIPMHTKQTRCNNNLIYTNDRDFFRPIISNIPTPLNYNHEHYTIDQNAINIYNLDIERSSISTRNKMNNDNSCNNSYNNHNANPVQNSFQNNNFMNFSNNSDYQDNEINKYLTRNPVNTRRDDIEKVRNNERQEFLKTQGGMLSNFNDFTYTNTRKNKPDINSFNYIPNARTMAIPKENI